MKTSLRNQHETRTSRGHNIQATSTCTQHVNFWHRRRITVCKSELTNCLGPENEQAHRKPPNERRSRKTRLPERTNFAGSNRSFFANQSYLTQTRKSNFLGFEKMTVSVQKKLATSTNINVLGAKPWVVRKLSNPYWQLSVERQRKLEKHLLASPRSADPSLRGMAAPTTQSVGAEVYPWALWSHKKVSYYTYNTCMNMTASHIYMYICMKFTASNIYAGILQHRIYARAVQRLVYARTSQHVTYA